MLRAWTKRKLAWNCFQASLLDPHTNPSALVAVLIMLVMLVSSMVAVRPPSLVVWSLVWISGIIAARVTTIISRMSVTAVPHAG